jgi:hypothetical protein
MLIRTCFKCEFHGIREFEGTGKSYCKKEGCWAEFSDCIIKKAIERFLKEETEYPGNYSQTASRPNNIKC